MCLRVETQDDQNKHQDSQQEQDNNERNKTKARTTLLRDKHEHNKIFKIPKIKLLPMTKS